MFALTFGSIPARRGSEKNNNRKQLKRHKKDEKEAKKFFFYFLFYFSLPGLKASLRVYFRRCGSEMPQGEGVCRGMGNVIVFVRQLLP